jgi:hypothetical protein
MKRYLLFCGDNYYPEGGAKDLVLFCDDIDDAINEALCRDGGLYTWSNIYDVIAEKIIWDLFYSNFGLLVLDENIEEWTPPQNVGQSYKGKGKAGGK